MRIGGRRRGVAPSAPGTRRISGHTLMEMLVVCALLVLVFGLAMPRLVEALASSRIQEAVRGVRADIQYVRARAISTGIRHALIIDGSTGEILAEPQRSEMEVQNLAPEQQQAMRAAALRDRLPEEVTLTQWEVSLLGQTQVSTQTSDGPITFYPEGHSDSARIVFEDRQGNRRGLILDGALADLREMTPEELR